MQYNKKTQAYTLSEIIVVLILTSIVVGLAFSVLRMVQNQLFSIRENFEHTTEFRKLEQSLKLDINRYPNLSYDNQNQKLKFKTPVDSVSYQFYENYIVKEKRDTFSIAISNKHFFKQGSKVENGEIDAIKLQTSKKHQSRVIFLFKREAAADYMK